MDCNSRRAGVAIVTPDDYDHHMAAIGQAQAGAVLDHAELLEDDIENTSIEAGTDLMLATLMLEHVNWRRGVEAMTGLRSAACGIVIQKNPPEMASAVTPGRELPSGW